MVLCKHFQTGNCRFGSKCNNEHIDIKQLVKNDMECAVNGKQFPFSCYGPFKDKPSIPNFIEDQSFEEIRLLCYEAKQNNQFDQFHQNFLISATEATNKMKALIQPSYELLNLLILMYDSPTGTVNDNSSNVVTSTDANSIFGKSTIANSSIGGNVYGGGSIFGGGVTNTNNNAGSIFGGQTNIAAQQQASIFGQHQQQQPQQQQVNSGSIFGGIAKPSIFGQQQTTAPVSGAGSLGIFAQAAQQTGLFNQQPQQQQQQPLQTNSFVQNAFSMQPAQQTVGGFQQQQQQLQPQQQQQTQNLFAQNAQQTMNQQQPSMMGSNIFAQAMQQTNIGAPTGGLFQQNGAGAFSQQGTQQQQLQHQAQAQQEQQQQFMSEMPQNNQFQNVTPQDNVNNNVYSNMSDLTPEEIEAFKADFFETGKVPLSPPPFELVN